MQSRIMRGSRGSCNHGLMPMLPHGLKATDFVRAKHTVCNDHAVDAHAMDGHPGVAALPAKQAVHAMAVYIALFMAMAVYMALYMAMAVMLGYSECTITS